LGKTCDAEVRENRLRRAVMSLAIASRWWLGLWEKNLGGSGMGSRPIKHIINPPKCLQ